MILRAARAALLCLLLFLPAATGGEELDRIEVPHPVHQEMEVDCETCHAGISESESAREQHRPEMDVCADCHDVDDFDLCGTCHANVDAAGDYAPREWSAPKFSHAAHIGKGMECADCHGALGAGDPVIPGKPVCRACHETADAFADCAFCHAADFELRPVSHGSDWIHRHGLEAGGDLDACRRCHTQNQCQDCHAGDNLRPRTHDLNFAFEHAVEARSGEMDCFACHDDPGYCAACHAAEHILPRSHSRVGWVRLSDGGQHALDGLFEIESCIACHDGGASAPTCVPCHGD